MELREVLEKVGIEEKAIQQIIAKMKAEKIYTTSQENADIRIKKYKEKQGVLEGYLAEARKKSDSFKELRDKNIILTEEIKTIKRNATEKEFNTILNIALRKARAKNNKLVITLLDIEKLELKDGKIEGLEEQIKYIKGKNAFLFNKVVNGIPNF